MVVADGAGEVAGELGALDDPRPDDRVTLEDAELGLAGFLDAVELGVVELAHAHVMQVGGDRHRLLVLFGESERHGQPLGQLRDRLGVLAQMGIGGLTGLDEGSREVAGSATVGPHLMREAELLVGELQRRFAGPGANRSQHRKRDPQAGPGIQQGRADLLVVLMQAAALKLLPGPLVTRGQLDATRLETLALVGAHGILVGLLQGHAPDRQRPHRLAVGDREHCRRDPRDGGAGAGEGRDLLDHPGRVEAKGRLRGAGDGAGGDGGGCGTRPGCRRAPAP